MTLSTAQLARRQAIGIQSVDFELSDDDYYQLFVFDLPNGHDENDAFERFKKSCDQVAAKWPTRAQFRRIDERYINSDE